MLLALVILLATYTAIISDRVNRAVAAMLGGSAMVLAGLIDQDGAVHGIDWNTIALLTGMMLIVAIAKRSGLFEAIAIAAAHLVKARPAALLAMLQVVTAVLSALLDNVTTVLLVVPVTLVLTKQLKLQAFPFLVSLIMASNIGGTATLIGDPPNILIGSRAGLTFNQFLVHLTPIAVLIMAVQIAMTHWLWGRHLTTAAEDRVFVLAEAPSQAVTDWTGLWQAVAVIGAVIAMFVVSRQVHIEPGTSALAGGSVLLFLDCLRQPHPEQGLHVEKMLGEIDWVTIFFFLGLFVVVAGIERSGLLGLVAQGMLSVTGGSHLGLGMVILWGAAVLSAIVDNIPFVATMIPIVNQLAPQFGGAAGLEPIWWALALGACLGGNGTLIGASANLAVAGLADQAGEPLSFWGFTRVAAPMTVVSVAIAALYVAIRYFSA
jgi:Na+/H+ antiporter NhaD/arsenite permease-like protein